MPSLRKTLGAYYTPEPIVQSLAHWVVDSPTDTLLDPACGDGRFLTAPCRTTGIEPDAEAAAAARQRAPRANVHTAEFFAWAASATAQFDCAAGNPPFIRYQRFSGEVRQRALQLCAALGAPFSALTSSWAPFLVVTASLLKPGGRMAFVVPAEIGHAPYAQPLIEYLFRSFGELTLVAVRAKLFPELSEDAWLLYAARRGESAHSLRLVEAPVFTPSVAPPERGIKITRADWRAWGGRLRPFLLPAAARALYRSVADDPQVPRLGGVAQISIGYVTGANDFFHLRPSQARAARIPDDALHITVRNGRVLSGEALTPQQVAAWREQDDPCLLLRLEPGVRLTAPIARYLASEEAALARSSYKCTNRSPWYAVPDVVVPHAFLSYMSGMRPLLVANEAGCAATNSVHTVRLNGRMPLAALQAAWRHPLSTLSCEIEGHPLGGGMLKLEPREAQRVVLGGVRGWRPAELAAVAEGIEVMRQWRHCGNGAETRSGL